MAQAAFELMVCSLWSTELFESFLDLLLLVILIPDSKLSPRNADMQQTSTAASSLDF